MTGRRLPALLLVGMLACASAAGQNAAPRTEAPATTAAAVPAATPPATAPLRTAPALPQPAQPMAAASAGNLVQTITGLLIVLAALALFAWAMKRFGPKAQSAAGGLRIVSALNLGGRERIIVVEVGEQWIVVGAAPGRVNALATMPKQEAGPLVLGGDTPVPAATSFSDWLKQTIDKRNAK